MAVPMAALGNSLLDAQSATEFSAISSDSGTPPPADEEVGYTRARAIVGGAYTTWASTTIPDLTMADHPDGLDPNDYEDFVVVR
jgi:hypothetical protein